MQCTDKQNPPWECHKPVQVGGVLLFTQHSNLSPCYKKSCKKPGSWRVTTHLQTQRNTHYSSWEQHQRNFCMWPCCSHGCPKAWSHPSCSHPTDWNRGEEEPEGKVLLLMDISSLCPVYKIMTKPEQLCYVCPHNNGYLYGLEDELFKWKVLLWRESYVRHWIF